MYLFKCIMFWTEIKDILYIKKIKNILNLTDYRSDELNIHLDKLYNKKPIENTSETNTEVFSNSEIMSQDISNIYKKPWNKLLVVHQIIKVKEFCNKICTNKNSQINMEKKLIINIKNKTLNKNSINYDQENGRIISIYNLNKICNSINL